MITTQKLINSIMGQIAVANEINSDFIQLTKGEGKALLKRISPCRAVTAPEEGSGTWWFACECCRTAVDPGNRFCRFCGRELAWDG